MSRMLEGNLADVSEYLKWDNTGRLLLIPDEKTFVEKVCKVHFAQKSITSFVSQSLSLHFLPLSPSATQADYTHFELVIRINK
jgi:hypothetical protein